MKDDKWRSSLRSDITTRLSESVSGDERKRAADLSSYLPNDWAGATTPRINNCVWLQVSHSLMNVESFFAAQVSILFGAAIHPVWSGRLAKQNQNVLCTSGITLSV
jgi:hypothetical protein